MMLSFPFFARALLLHIPDGFLSLPVAVIAWLLTAVFLRHATRRGQEQLDDRLVPLAGVMAAFIFAGQMINFPVAGGTSGHLIGATLAVIVLGPWLGILAMTAVISLQALLFQDGGLTSMGANVLVMAVIPALVGYGFYQLAAARSRTLRLVAAGGAAWLSVMAAAFITALLLGLSGTVSFRLVMPAMLGLHALIGIGEALITAAVLSFIMSARPQLLDTTARADRRWIVAAITVTLAIVLLAPLASALPDGLEWVAGQAGFIDAAREAPYHLLPDYTVPILGDTNVSTIAAGVAGVLIVAAVTMTASKLLQRKHKRSGQTTVERPCTH